MDGRKNNSGTKGNKGGRKPKAEEHKLIEKLSPLEEKAYKALSNALDDEQGWAIKLFFEYMYGKAKQQKEIDITTKGESLNYTKEERDKRIQELVFKCSQN